MYLHNKKFGNFHRAQPYDGYLSDMWSAGIVLYVMTTGMMPYDDKNVKKMLERQLQHRL